MSAHPVERQRLDIYYDALTRAGLRLTPQRRTICEYLASTDSHPSAYEVYAAVEMTNPEISRATVYNTLNTLQQLGAVVELSFGSDHTHYDTNPQPHINLICLRCHQIIDYAGDFPDETLRERIFAEAGFQTAAAKVDLVGFCAECRAKRRAEIVALSQGSADATK